MPLTYEHVTNNWLRILQLFFISTLNETFLSSLYYESRETDDLSYISRINFIAQLDNNKLLLLSDCHQITQTILIDQIDLDCVSCAMQSHCHHWRLYEWLQSKAQCHQNAILITQVLPQISDLCDANLRATARHVK